MRVRANQTSWFMCWIHGITWTRRQQNGHQRLANYNPWVISSLPPVFYKCSFIATLPHSFVYINSMAGFPLQGQRKAVATDTVSPTKPKHLLSGILQKIYTDS